MTLGLVETIAFGDGGVDRITTGNGGDIVLGGMAGDEIDSGAGMDIVLGDNGLIDHVLRERDLGSSFADLDASDIDLITTQAPNQGGNDTIVAGEGNDIVFGGTGSDTINGNQGNDLIFGDHGKVEARDRFGAERTLDAALLPLNLNLAPALTLTPDQRPVHPFTWTSIDTRNSDDGAADLIRGNDGNDIIIGGQGGDLITGGAGDDDIIGGHNGNLVLAAPGAGNALGGHDGADKIDAGSGNDTVAGDNADLLRTGAPISVRMRVISGETIYDGDGQALVTAQAQVDPTAAVVRFVQLYDHNDAPMADTFGGDSIAGGADDDVIFGQLGDDDIQGDGSVIDDEGRVTVNARAARASVEDFAGSGRDGDDYIEGNGGNDLIFGNLGQDDLIGDSSNQFSLLALTMRPTGADTVFGGAGTRIERNDIGTTCDCDASVDGHSRDADTILGDNGNIFRLVGTRGVAPAAAAFLTFNHDESAAGHKIIPRAFVLLDYTQGARAAADRGNDDLLHGEGGDDTLHGMTGNDVIFGEGEDDDLYGGSGYDRLYGGTGADGILGDDGKLRTSRNGLTEPLNGLFTANAQALLETNGPFVGAVSFVAGELNKSVDLAAFELGSADVIYGGLGCDFLHGGAGDDAISGAEAQREFYTEVPQTALALGYDPSNPLGYDPVTRKLAAYDANNPRTRIEGFLLNFDTHRIDERTGQVIMVNGLPVKSADGVDRIFGDLGNDWLVGGTGADRMFGGRGDDMLNADDNHDTQGGLNGAPDAVQFADADFAYGGAGLDVLIANTGGDRLFDWSGEFNSFIVPFGPFGAPTVNRLLSPSVKNFVQALGAAEGADPTIFEPDGELGLVDQDDADWNAQHGGPRDPQPGNIGGVQRDTQGGKEDMANPPDCGCDCVLPTELNVQILKSVNGADANTGSGPLVVVGSTVSWSYQISNPTGRALVVTSVRDDAGTVASTADDFTPTPTTIDVGGVAYNVGDINRDGRLDTFETWVYTASAPAIAGDYVNVAVVTAVDATGRPYSNSDIARYRGVTTVPTGMRIEKAINAADPAAPTPAEDADTAPGPTLLVGTPLTFTYQVFNDGAGAISITSITDDAGTAGLASDDFTPAALTVVVGGNTYNLGDTDRDGLLDPGEAWRYTSAGTPAGNQVARVGAQVNLATVTGLRDGIVISDDDAAHYLGVTSTTLVQVRLETAVNAANPAQPTAYEDADAATGPILAAGSSVVWTYLLRNEGNVPVSVTSVRDNAGSPANAADDFTPAAVTFTVAGVLRNVGDLDADGLLDAGETWQYRATGTAASGQYAALGSASVLHGASGATASASDPTYLFGAAAGVQVVKAVNAANPASPSVIEDANNPATPVALPVGSTVVYSYAVRNTGADALASVTLVDDAGTPGVAGDDFVPAPVTTTVAGRVYNTGDSNKNGLLDRTETWLYRASRIVVAGTTTNYATVTAVNNRTQLRVLDDDPASILGTVARIDVESAVNAVNPTQPTAAEDADSLPVNLVVGNPVTWTYQVSNAGNGPLTISSLRDDAGTPAVTTDDFTPAPVLSAGYNVGDTDRDNQLDVGETWRYSASGTVVAGARTNSVSAVGTDPRTGATTTDTDLANYVGQAASIRVAKAVNALQPSDPTRYEAADVATGPMLPVGSAVTWTYQVFNLGEVELDVIDLSDSDGFMPVLVADGGDVDGDGRLDPGEVWLYSSRAANGQAVTGATATALAGQQSNTATVRASNDAGRIFTDDDRAHYFGTAGGISVVKAINATNPNQPTPAQDANNPSSPFALTAGSVPTFTFQVRNLGAQALGSVVLVDDAATDAAGDDFTPAPVLQGLYNVGDTDRDRLLDPNETWLYTSAGVYTTKPVQGAHVNVVRVSASNVVTGATVRDDDTAHYVVTALAQGDGRMTGGGSVYTDAGTRVTHGFELHSAINFGPNNLQVNFDRNSFHLEQLTAIRQFDDPNLNPLPRPAYFDTVIGEGLGRFNGQSGYRVWFEFTDNGEPGKKDFARIEIRDPNGNLVLFVAGNLNNGNHQAHPAGTSPTTAQTLQAVPQGMTRMLAAEPQPAAPAPTLVAADSLPAPASPWQANDGGRLTTRMAEPSVAPPRIDWVMAAPTPVAPARPLAAAPTEAWVKDFVNHLGRSDQQRNPNAALRLHIEPTLRTTPSLESSMAR